MDEIVAALVAARRGGPLLPVGVQATHTPSTAEIHDIQSRVAATAGPVGGWKVGRTPDGDHFWAPIFTQDIHHGDADLARPPGTQVGIEVEIAFRLSETLRPGRPEEAVDAAFVVVEYLQSRLERYEDASPAWKLADNQSNGGLVVGQEIADWRGRELGRQAVRVWKDAELVLDETRDNPGGDPLRLLDWALAQGPDHCGGLRPGQIVTTGSLSGAPWYPAGTGIRAQLPDLGATVTLTI